MPMPSAQQIDAEAIRLGIAVDGQCPPRARAQIATSLLHRGNNISDDHIEDLHVTVARLDRNLVKEGCDSEHVRAAAIGAFVAAILTPTNIETTQ